MNPFPRPPTPAPTHTRPPQPTRTTRAKSPASLAILAILTCAIGSTLLACGPFFPHSLLLDGDRAVLRAPNVFFETELDRLQLTPPPGLLHLETEASDREATLAAEILDLRRALATRNLDTNRIAEAILLFSRTRADLEDYRQSLEFLSFSPDDPAPNPPPEPDLHALPPEIPREFQLYLAGARAWISRNTNEARTAWQSILDLPPGQQRFKSTWAAFMLGRSWHTENPATATRHYQQTRKLARTGLPDSASLGVASLGWEAQLMLRTNRLGPALHLYLEQYAAGATRSAGPSLELTARRITEAQPDARLAVARDPVARRVVTAWLLASIPAVPNLQNPDNPNPPTDPLVLNWLHTLETLGAAEVPLAEQLALLTYRAGDWDAAERWIALSGDSPIADWLQAKLHLRNGKPAEAAQAFARALPRLPIPPPSQDPHPDPAIPQPFADSLYDPDGSASAQEAALAESGVLHLARGDFIQALDALLRAKHWTDAAYVAERVLTTQELKAYVDTHWPATTTPDPDDPLPVSERIRHLLGRRLTRSNLGLLATPYFPTNLHNTHHAFLSHLARGENTSLQPRERAHGFFAAAGLARTNGLDLLGTEVAPDWAIWYGDFQHGPTHTRRAESNAQRLPPTPAEWLRANQHRADPEQRFHYRYQAAFLAWDAAQLMPDNDPETALMLHTAGQWLKTRDPKTADIFYKALVRRCRATELGEAADRQRWFPNLDALGKPIVTRLTPTPTPTTPDPAFPPDDWETSDSQSSPETNPDPPIDPESNPDLIPDLLLHP